MDQLREILLKLAEEKLKMNEGGKIIIDEEKRKKVQEGMDSIREEELKRLKSLIGLGE